MVATKGLHRGIGGAQLDEVASGPNQTLPGPRGDRHWDHDRRHHEHHDRDHDRRRHHDGDRDRGHRHGHEHD
jgi:hypothetical protein